MDLSFKKLSDYFFGTREKEAKRREARETGMCLEEIAGEETKRQKDSLYLGNAVLNFLIVFGTTGCLMESLEITWRPFVLFPVLLLAAVGMSFFYRNRWFRLFGYVTVVGGILLSLQQFLLLFRSGFALICNRLMHVVEDVLFLPVEREYEVYVENHDMAVVMCLALIGVVMELFFNIIVSEMKNYWIVLLFSFPLVQLPIYLNQKLPAFYFMLYCAGIIAMYAIRSSGHFGVPDKKQGDYVKKKLGKKSYIAYRFDGESSIGVMLAVLAVALFVVVGFTIAYPVARFEESHTEESVWKANSRGFARRFALVGFWGMFSNTGEGTGGVGTGKLGNIERVRMDFEPDFYVYTAKLDGERTLYLRSFCGKEYRDNEWIVEAELGEQEYCVHFQPSDEFLYLDLQDGDAGRLPTVKKELVLENVGAGMQYAYYPYWNVTDAKSYLTGGKRKPENRLAIGKFVKQEYQVLFGELSVAELKDMVKEAGENRQEGLWQEFTKAEEEYRRTVYSAYLQVEEKQKERLLSLCSQNGIFPEDKDVVEKVRDFLQENYTYTLMPGVTPKNKDFVDYFLFEQKKGYCVYFASAATLMFRSLGIPARYVCGYAAFSDAFSEAERTDREELQKWLEKDELYRLELTDANAHAWVEIYLDGFGWLPVEVTTAMVEDVEEDENNFAGIGQFISNLFSPETVAAVRKTTVRLGMLVAAAALLALAALPVACLIVRKRRRRRFLVEDAGAGVCAMYFYLNRLAALAGCVEQRGSNYRQRGEEIGSFFGFSLEDMENLVRLMEQARFSSMAVTKEEQRGYFEKTRGLSEAMLLRIKQPKRFLVGMAYRF